MTSTFDYGDMGPKGPSMAKKLPLGESKFSPWVHVINWRSRVDKEAKAAIRAPPRSLSALAGSSWEADEQSRASSRLTHYLHDPKVRHAVTMARHRVNEIRNGSPISSIKVPKTKREIILASAAPFLTRSHLSEL